MAEVEEATASASEAVKLPQIETKKRRGGRKTTNAWPETNNVTIEEFVPTLVNIYFFRFLYIVHTSVLVMNRLTEFGFTV